MALILNCQFGKKGKMKGATELQRMPPNLSPREMRGDPPLPGCGERNEVRGGDSGILFLAKGFR